ncbi:MAG: hypothetical protein J6A90_01750, partial [Clostridia bacterium]|nr:hypothetical protein [Clostridia bacterium]
LPLLQPWSITKMLSFCWAFFIISLRTVGEGLAPPAFTTLVDYKNAQLLLGIFYYLFENNYDCPIGQVMSYEMLRLVMMPCRAF